MSTGIRDVRVQRGDDDSFKSVRVVFGPHHFVEVRSGEDDQVEFRLGATHHGFKADASEINGELEGIVNEVRRSHPNKVVD